MTPADARIKVLQSFCKKIWGSTYTGRVQHLRLQINGSNMYDIEPVYLRSNDL